MWLTPLICFFLAILSGLGLGSAGLFVTWLTLAERAPQLTAQGINLLFFIFSAGAALVIHTFRTPLLWQSLLFLLPAGVLGGILGSSLATVMPQELLRQIFGFMLILTGIFGLFSCKNASK